MASGECIEALIYLAQKLQEEPEASSSTPLAAWEIRLREEGYNPCEVAEFFCSAELMEAWQGPDDLPRVYSLLASSSASTGDLIQQLLTEESGYMGRLSEALDRLIQDRDQLIAVAGGEMKHPIVGWTGIALMTLLVGTVVGVNRKTIASGVRRGVNYVFRKEVGDLANDAIDQASNEVAHQLGDELRSSVSSDNLSVRSSLREVDRLSQQDHNSEFDNALARAHRAINRMAVRAIDDPQRFLEEMIKDQPDMFKTDMTDYFQTLATESNNEVNKIQLELNTYVTKKIKKQAIDDLLIYDENTYHQYKNGNRSDEVMKALRKQMDKTLEATQKTINDWKPEGKPGHDLQILIDADRAWLSKNYNIEWYKLKDSELSERARQEGVHFSSLEDLRKEIYAKIVEAENDLELVWQRALRRNDPLIKRLVNREGSVHTGNRYKTCFDIYKLNSFADQAREDVKKRFLEKLNYFDFQAWEFDKLKAIESHHGMNAADVARQYADKSEIRFQQEVAELLKKQALAEAEDIELDMDNFLIATEDAAESEVEGDYAVVEDFFANL